MDNKLLDDIVGLLTPIKDQEWHGKWRIQKAIEMCSNKHPEALLPWDGKDTIITDKAAYRASYSASAGGKLCLKCSTAFDGEHVCPPQNCDHVFDTSMNEHTRRCCKCGALSKTPEQR